MRSCPLRDPACGSMLITIEPMPVPGATLSSEAVPLLPMDNESLMTMDPGPELGFDPAGVAYGEPVPFVLWCTDVVRERLKSVEEKGVKEASEVDDLLAV